MNGTAIADNFPSSAVESPVPRKPRQPPSPPGQTPRWFESPEKTEKYTAFQLLREQGFSPEKSAEMIGYAPATGWAIERKLKAFRAESGAPVGFLTDKRIKRAGAVVDKFMRGETFGNIKEIKDSTVLRAAETVLDRSHPKRADSDERPSVSFVTINLGMMALSGADPGPSVDITPSVQGDTPSLDGFISDGI